MKIPTQVKKEIEKIAKEFSLNFDKKDLDYIKISVREEILTEFIGGCWDPIYKKYGKNQEERAKNIKKFINSKDFQKCLKRYGGQVMDKGGIKQDLKIAQKIEDPDIKEELKRFYKKVLNRLNRKEITKISTITKPRNKKEEKWQIEYCLREEWLHNLMKSNNLFFQKKNKNLWPYDEGLATYCAYYLDSKLDRLEKDKKKEKIPTEKKYFIYAIKFRELLKNAKTSEERRGILIKLKKSLK